jgi:hypothetical protein
MKCRAVPSRSEQEDKPDQSDDSAYESREDGRSPEGDSLWSVVILKPNDRRGSISALAFEY